MIDASFPILEVNYRNWIYRVRFFGAIFASVGFVVVLIALAFSRTSESNTERSDPRVWALFGLVFMFVLTPSLSMAGRYLNERIRVGDGWIEHFDFTGRLVTSCRVEDVQGALITASLEGMILKVRTPKGDIKAYAYGTGYSDFERLILQLPCSQPAR